MNWKDMDFLISTSFALIIFGMIFMIEDFTNPLIFYISLFFFTIGLFGNMIIHAINSNKIERLEKEARG